MVQPVGSHCGVLGSPSPALTSALQAPKGMEKQNEPSRAKPEVKQTDKKLEISLEM